MESMSALACGVAHEFNNLMTVVAGSVERALGRVSDDRQRQYLARADWASRRAGQLAAELLSLARRQTCNETAVDLNQVVRGLKGTLAQVAGDDVQLDFELTNESVPVRLDADQFELVLLNLVRNAVDATAGGGDILLATRALTGPEAAEILNSSAALEVSVTDTGTGMAPEVVARATELFFTTKAAGKGTGLGLFLALQFVDQAGGKLVIDSAVNRGTTIRMALSSSRVPSESIRAASTRRRLSLEQL